MLNIKADRGIALLLSLLVMVILLTLGGAYLFMAATEANIAKNQRSSNEAFYIAEARIERGIRKLCDDNGWRTNGSPLVEYLGSGKYSLEAVDELDKKGKPTGIVIITSEGEVELAKRMVEVKAEFSCYKYALLADVDIDASSASGKVKGDVHANNTADMGAIVVEGTITQGSLGDPLVTIPQIDMSYYEENADEVYVGDTTFDKKNYKNLLIYVKGDATIDTKKDVNFKKSSLIVEGNTTIIGGKKLRMERKGSYPALATKLGDIKESGSGNKQKNRDIKGIVYSEQGVVEFESIKLQGEIIAKDIKLINKVDIKYNPKFTVPPPDFIGGLSEIDWYEVY